MLDNDRSAKAGAAFFFLEMSSSSNVVTIKIGKQDPKEWLSDLHEAICQVQMLVFERRELDLGEPETYALYVLARLQGQIVS